jgi:hypothetical protein
LTILVEHSRKADLQEDILRVDRILQFGNLTKEDRRHLGRT